jgi:hypothetical protein
MRLVSLEAWMHNAYTLVSDLTWRYIHLTLPNSFIPLTHFAVIFFTRFNNVSGNKPSHREDFYSFTSLFILAPLSLVTLLVCHLVMFPTSYYHYYY